LGASPYEISKPMLGGFALSTRVGTVMVYEINEEMTG
jgi:hypothetical protein